MENYENKELLKEAAKQSLGSLKDLKPGTEEYTNTAKMALQLYDMQLKSDEQESNQNLKEDEERRKGQEVINDQEKAAKARRIEWAKFGISCLTFLGTIGTTVYWSICEAGGRGESCGLSLFFMRYHDIPPKEWTSYYGSVYRCNHPVYRVCTLYREQGKGLCVIQQRYNEKTKATYWSAIDPWLTDKIYLHEGFRQYFDSHAKKKNAKGEYPTVTVRQIMWALRMKPLKKERWETVFDRSLI